MSTQSPVMIESAEHNTILMVAFHFPPIATSSGMQRTLKFVKYLRTLGWNPVVLTVQPKAYGHTSDSQINEIPEDVPVYRAFGLDARRHLAIKGKYLESTAMPDAWISWYPFAVLRGLSIIRKHSPDLIWSTSPIATTHMIALTLQRLTNLPWVADFRDPMTLDAYPSHPLRRKFSRWIEKKTIENASYSVFTAKRTRDIYLTRYPALENRSSIISNGFDPANFPQHIMTSGSRVPLPSTKIRLLHTGALPADGRNPKTLFQAIRQLIDAAKMQENEIEVVLRGTENDSAYQSMIADFKLAGIVRLEPHLPYEKAIAEMIEADILLLLQGTVYNHAIPAKLYEYLYTRKPILALVDKKGETASVLSDMGISTVASIDDVADITQALSKLVQLIRSGLIQPPIDEMVMQYSRRKHAKLLGNIFLDVLEL